jgi:hypothetical protein
MAIFPPWNAAKFNTSQGYYKGCVAYHLMQATLLDSSDLDDLDPAAEILAEKTHFEASEEVFF